MNLFHFHQIFPSQRIPLSISILNDFLLKALIRNSFRYVLWPPKITTNLQKP
ncbi:hypothetical protein HanRHA438_Chr12g0558311 [Helianthus annuus]|uniref:Uncharacterized protein n=1 Tax=Helianthus annuus TaxID=4232 RepID=A0A251T3X1_HELAN|nr:hypothetical protein HanXRQr2_Chr12g0546971 [Helianthus annuus]KAJ0489803.1 hypothetical protein HanHA300_Chr12g0448141 [Helianthus annuus]KAJ0505718.1 hypothetical protein HanHA89_Chr12g0473661 [Helianthus annuus]KAJ0675387.1 hypothetical protein HanLR1_Chr12g0450601 [Helianthus annuus]KAJ0678682.1 hypothetical protein HanOQP8_Chr12g0450661 [Helianthus annuus]